MHDKNRHHKMAIEKYITSSKLCGDGLRETRQPPRGETLREAVDRTARLRLAGLCSREGGVLQGEKLLRGLRLRRSGEAL